MTLVEVLVVLAILVALASLVVVSYSQIMRLEQREVAKTLALTYEALHDQAVLRNVTFRIAYHLDGNYYEVEVGDPKVLIFDDPEAREDYEDEIQDQLRRYTEREIEEGEADHLKEEGFAALQERFAKRVDLPRGTRFAGVYTPQYEDMVEPSGADEEDPEEPLIVYSYIFANGFAEHTVVQIVERNDEDEGYSIEVEPLSGRVHLHPELIRWDDTYGWVPEEGPELDL